MKTIFLNKNFRDILTIVVIAGVIFIGLRVTIQNMVVDGSSMLSTLHNGQWILVSKIVYKFNEPERGDIVTFHSPDGDEGNLIKRIIGLPGETVEIKKGIVHINKENGSVLQLDESYVTKQSPTSFIGDKIPEDEYFVMGDNRLNSRDSRSGWTLPRESIIGKAWLSVWPPGDWGLAANHSFEE